MDKRRICTGRCIDAVNKKLSSGFTLDVVVFLNSCKVYPRISTSGKPYKSGRSKPGPPVIPIFCPFCGFKYE